MFDLSTGSRKTIFFSTLISAVIGLLSIVDLIYGFPFMRSVVFDLIFLLCSTIMVYLGYETWKEFPSVLSNPKPRNEIPQSNNQDVRNWEPQRHRKVRSIDRTPVSVETDRFQQMSKKTGQPSSRMQRNSAHSRQ